MSTFQRQEDLFDQALALPAGEREAWLARTCVDDEPLRKKVWSLLLAHEEAKSFMESAPTDLTHSSSPGFEVPTEEKPGDRIGRYKILQKIGEGGCGVVFMAEQEESVRRRVALKVIKLGMDTKAVIARFEAERQALARMEHPNIARVLDAGATAAGRPFFVMELVRGMRITDYCDQSNLSTEQRLDLFIKVCQAIQHAHQKGVIHRDIKPSNILVTLHDGAPVPKVIDFGIAKATQGRLTEQTLFTAFEQFIGTPAYVSPEQAEMSGLDIDTRSDIYSLGVLLYELLTGRTPFDMHELVESGLDEMRSRIREQEPPRPSARLRTLNDDDRTIVARRRGTDGPRLTLRLRGDLDWIVMRCLEKDRSRRYETANGLATDILRHLENEPVTARPPSTAYLTQKLVRRHRLAFGAGAAIAVVLVAGLVVCTRLWLRAVKAERIALQQKTDAEAGRTEAQKGERDAREQAARREKLASDITGMLKNIGLLFARNGDPGGDRRHLREALDQARKRKKELIDQPEIEADVDETLGGYYFKLAEYKIAEELLNEAINLRRRTPDGETAPEVAKALHFLGLVYSAQLNWIKAEDTVKDALKLLQDRLTPRSTGGSGDCPRPFHPGGDSDPAGQTG
ncbi:MAG: serine/threonine protein kinase [Opitutus sp.]|nr:serine/threonine protein kinase [Opitutus sp.]